MKFNKICEDMMNFKDLVDMKVGDLATDNTPNYDEPEEITTDAQDEEGLVNLFRGYIKNAKDSEGNEMIMDEIFSLLKKLEVEN